MYFRYIYNFFLKNNLYIDSNVKGNYQSSQQIKIYILLLSISQTFIKIKSIIIDYYYLYFYYKQLYTTSLILINYPSYFFIFKLIIIIN